MVGRRLQNCDHHGRKVNLRAFLFHPEHNQGLLEMLHIGIGLNTGLGTAQEKAFLKCALEKKTNNLLHFILSKI